VLLQAYVNSRYLYEVITVDDNSPDGTAEVARKLSSRFPVKVGILSARCPEKVMEVPRVIQRRKYGKSKLTFKEIINYARDLYRLQKIYGN